MKEKTIRIEDGGIHESAPSEIDISFISEMHSDIGVCRQVNQDACCARMMKIDGHSLALAAVCDGVGGLQEGEYASKRVIQFLNHWFDYTVSKNIQGKNQEQIICYLYDEMEKGIQQQNRLIYEYAKEKGIKTGTTLTLLMIIDWKYITAQIGDSRAYLINSGLKQLTEDQSVVAREIKAGRLSSKEAKYDKRRNIILQCIGASKELHIVYQSGSVNKEDVFFLCSDGFVHELEETEIKDFFCPISMQNRSAIKKNLMDAVSLVKRRGEKDNITVVLVKII